MIIQKKGLLVNIPILEVMIMFRNYNKEDELAITEQLRGPFSQALEHGEAMPADRSSSELDVEVKPLVRKLFDEKREITKVSTGCLVLSIQCHDIGAVISLVQDNLSGKFGSLFEPLEEVMRTYDDHALFEVYVVCQVSEKCGKRSYTVESTVQDDGIAVKIQRFLESFTEKENRRVIFLERKTRYIQDYCGKNDIKS
ncbi:hypothetical protein MAR_015881 [Mya arenaria]|uniref:Uncharacterized protein n=1 Tax=Mya arenaria TaxID=6604 RepID=A0ABY7FIF2_MYAAR|nr:hypothetical protein MAR_015881 [Mya arenaria]